MIPLFYALTPAIVAGYFFITKVQILSSKSFMGISVGFLGVMIVSFSTQINFEGTKIWSILLMFTAVFVFAAYTIKSQGLADSLKISPITIAIFICLTTLVLAIPFSFLEIQKSTSITNPTTTMVLSALAVGFLCTGAQQFLTQKSIQLVDATVASIFTYIQPIIGISLAVVFLSESLPLLTLLSGVLVLSGTYLVQLDQKNTQET